jgi:hypothetical protein
MHRLPNDASDPFEIRLAGLVRRYSEAAIVPIDPLAIARSAVLFAPGAGANRLVTAASAARLVGWVAVAALLAVLAIAALAFIGGSREPTVVTPTASPTASPTIGPTASPTASPRPTVAPTPTTPAVVACGPATVSVRVVQWEGAAGSRIATVELQNTGSGSCTIASVDRPQLVDGAQKILIDGATPTAAPDVEVAPGGKLTAMVRTGNYCGPVAPTAPVTVAFVLPDGSRLVAEPQSATDLFGVPPCNGPETPASIDMQPWQP